MEKAKWSKSVAGGEARESHGAENTKNSATRQKSMKLAHTTRQKQIADSPSSHLAQKRGRPK